MCTHVRTCAMHVSRYASDVYMYGMYVRNVMCVFVYVCMYVCMYECHVCRCCDAFGRCTTVMYSRMHLSIYLMNVCMSWMLVIYACMQLVMRVCIALTCMNSHINHVCKHACMFIMSRCVSQRHVLSRLERP